MDSNQPTDKRQSMLRTTTWGAIIALSVALSIFLCSDNLGLSPRTGRSQQSSLVSTLLRPHRTGQAQTSAKSAHQGSGFVNSLRGLLGLRSNSGSRLSDAQTLSAAAQTSQGSHASGQGNGFGTDGADRSMPVDGSPANGADEKAAVAAKLSPELRAMDPAARAKVIVQFRDGLTQDNLSAVLQEGGEKGASLPLVKAATFTLQGSALRTLASNSHIAYISPDRQVRGALSSTVAAINIRYARSAHRDGARVGVAVIDSAISNVGALDNPTRGFVVAYAKSLVPGDPTTADTYGHGTHVAGIIASEGNNSKGWAGRRHFYGVDPGVSLINLRVLDQSGAGSDSAVISAIQMAIQLKNQYNIGVINLSLGRPVYESYQLDPLCQAVEQAWQAGIVVAVAAGNYGRLN